ncbi:MAG: hypothetical protein RI918_2220 [Pseudomonadota bacterium]|jgi:hypothetical protein
MRGYDMKRRAIMLLVLLALMILAYSVGLIPNFT